MQTLIIVLFILSMLVCALQLSLYQSRWIKWGWVAVISLFVYLMHHWAVEQSYTVFRAILSNITLMMDFVVLQVLEASAGILMSIYMIRSFYNEPVKRFLRYAVYWPGLIIFPALFYFESLMFLNVQGFAFPVLALILSLGAGLLMAALMKGFKYLVPELELRLELKFIIHLLQLTGGIVLSVIMLRLPVNESSKAEILYQPMLVLLGVGCLGILVGLVINRWKVGRMSAELERYQNQ